jgi:TonB family protein
MLNNILLGTLLALSIMNGVAYADTKIQFQQVLDTNGKLGELLATKKSKTITVLNKSAFYYQVFDYQDYDSDGVSEFLVGSTSKSNGAFNGLRFVTVYPDLKVVKSNSFLEGGNFDKNNPQLNTESVVDYTFTYNSQLGVKTALKQPYKAPHYYHYFFKDGVAYKIEIPEVDMRPYIEAVQKKIGNSWKRPQDKEKKEAVTKLEINKDGVLISAKVLKSIGDKAFDENCLGALYEASPFPSFPDAYNEDTVKVEFTFSYGVL